MNQTDLDNANKISGQIRELSSAISYLNGSIRKRQVHCLTINTGYSDGHGDYSQDNITLNGHLSNRAIIVRIVEFLEIQKALLNKELEEI